MKTCLVVLEESGGREESSAHFRVMNIIKWLNSPWSRGSVLIKKNFVPNVEIVFHFLNCNIYIK